MNSFLGILCLVHLFFIVRYCVGSIVRDSRVTSADYLKWLVVVILIPVFGYVMYQIWLRKKLSS